MSSHDTTSSGKSDKGSKKSTAVYSLKIINPNNAGGELIINDLEIPKLPTSAEEFKAKVCEQFSKYIEGYDTEFGYIVPGHGKKGKQANIDTDEELEAMCEKTKKSKRIVLWLKCKPRSNKRVAPGSSEAPQSKRHASLVGMMSDVDNIVTKLKEKHGDKYTPVQLNCWAHMIHTHKHDSMEEPPNKSFFGKKMPSDAASTGGCVSPGKRISLRSECINQLDKWHQLKERGVISNEEYEELHKTILVDVKKF